MLRRVLMIVLISIVPVVTNTGTAHAETAYPAYCWDPNHWDAAKTGYASYDTPSRWSYESCWLGGSYRTFVTAGGDDSI